MATMTVQPRPTPAERAADRDKIEVDEGLAAWAAVIEDWVAYRPGWEFTLHEGHAFGRHNNVEGRLLFSSGEQTSSLMFRLDQLDGVEDLSSELLLRFEERDGIAKMARLTANGFDVEMFHILTFT